MNESIARQYLSVPTTNIAMQGSLQGSYCGPTSITSYSMVRMFTDNMTLYTSDDAFSSTVYPCGASGTVSPQPWGVASSCFGCSETRIRGYASMDLTGTPFYFPSTWTHMASGEGAMQTRSMSTDMKTIEIDACG